MNGVIRVGLLGCGTVGAAVARLLLEHPEELGERVGTKLEVRRVAIRSLDKIRDVDLPTDAWTTDPYDVVSDPDVDVVLELIGGIDPARDLITVALRNGKHVVTANKELIAWHGAELLGIAASSGRHLLYEASVAGGIPIVRPVQESLAGDAVKRLMGIVNGTTNFILTRMSESEESFGDALEEASRRGYAEADPSADVDGGDAAAKLAILASLAFHRDVRAVDVAVEGIRGVTQEDMAAAHAMGYEIKLIAVAEGDGEEISARVHPAMLPKTHPLASVRDVFNAVFVEATYAGELMFYGRGAGGGPTASAVVGDLIEVARTIVSGNERAGTPQLSPVRIRPPDDVPVRFYVVLSVEDQPGVLAAVAGVFADHNVSIASVRQEGSAEEATLTLITHVAPEGRHRATFGDLAGLPSVRGVSSTMRVLGTDES